MKPYLLVVADDAALQAQIRSGLASSHEVAAATDRVSALDAFRATRPLAVVLDLHLAGGAGAPQEALGTLADLLAVDPQVQTVGLYGPGAHDAARNASVAGIADFVRKPLELDELRLVLRRCMHVTRLERELRDTRVRAPHEVSEGLVGSCAAMQKLFDSVRKIATTEVPVLITGEPGTGKEAVARAIHQRSLRHPGPFVATNCSATPDAALEVELFGTARTPNGTGVARKGRIELAQGGTLLLDDIGVLPLPLQLQILRLLQEQVIERVGLRHPIPADCRLIAASTTTLEAAIAAGKFRRDLYYRLTIAHLHLPPLRERGDDILLLANFFLHRFSALNGRTRPALAADASQAIIEHPWPGNVRELQTRMRRAIIMCDGRAISAVDLGLRAAESAVSVGDCSLRTARERVERELVRRALLRHGGNVSAAAAALEVSRPTLYELMQKLGIQRTAPGPQPAPGPS